MARWMWVAILLVCAIAWAQQAEKKATAPSGKKAAMAEKAAPKKTAFTPDEIAWGPAPPFVEPEAQLAVLEGNPMGAAGDYTVRIKMPGGYKIAPHWHPKQENVTVISGTLKVGMGDKFDESKTQSFAAGSFAGIAPRMHHYAMADGETTIQIHGMAPLSITYVNPSDDPRNKNKKK
ncbi:MAG TPA: cupin domain-containing protein [Terriglobales bacterium]|jgi:quercetin dioxygenase-like cupin family protein|nr:cupin domain-containing protein [Terriglobales bacterium]